MILQSTTLECDRKHCGQTYTGSIAESRKSIIVEAQQHGWAFVRYVGRDWDYCPEHAATSIPLGMSELAFAQATIRDVHAILSRVPQGAAEPSNPEQSLLTEAQGLRLLHAVEDSAINEEYTDAVVEDLAVYVMGHHDPRGWPIGQTIRNRYQAIKDGSPVRDHFPEPANPYSIAECGNRGIDD